jgi:hypothetical protein
VLEKNPHAAILSSFPAKEAGLFLTTVELGGSVATVLEAVPLA